MLVLPAEISLYILSFLPISNICALQLVSRKYNEFVETNEATIYRQAAYYHRFIASDVVHFENAKGYIKGSWSDELKSWKDLCRCWMILERNWDGMGTIVEGTYPRKEGSGSIHGFRIDEDQHTLITTSPDSNSGGVIEVSALEDGTSLWCMNHPSMRPGAHCEFSEGFLVFGSQQQRLLQIWRRATDAFEQRNDIVTPASRTISTSSIQPSLSEIHEAFVQRSLNQYHQSEAVTSYSESLRGHFVLHAQIDPVEDLHRIRTYRLSYPTLVVAYDGINRLIVLYDVRTGQSMRRIDLDASIQAMGGSDVIAEGHARGIFYVDVTSRWVLVCMMGGIVIIPRGSEEELQTEDIAVGLRDELGTGNADRMIFFPSPDMDLEVPQFSREGAMLLARCYYEGFDRNRGLPDVQHNPRNSLGKWSMRVRGSFGMERMTLKQPLRTFDGLGSRYALVWVGATRLQFYTAGHFSPSGKHIAIVNGDGLLFIIVDFARVARGEATFPQITMKINLGEIATNLTWDGDDKRFALVTRGGVYIVNIDPLYHRTPLDTDSSPLPRRQPKVNIHRLSHFSEASALDNVTCLQMNKMGLWITYGANALRECLCPDEIQPNDSRCVCFADFSNGVMGQELERYQIVE